MPEQFESRHERAGDANGKGRAAAKYVAVAIVGTLFGGTLLGGVQAMTATRPKVRWQPITVEANGGFEAAKLPCRAPNLPNFKRPNAVGGGFATVGHELVVLESRPMIDQNARPIGWRIEVYNPTDETWDAQVDVVCEA